MYFPGVLQFDQARAVVLRTGEEMQADFAMRRIKLVEVAGRVMGADGASDQGVAPSLGGRGTGLVQWIGYRCGRQGRLSATQIKLRVDPENEFNRNRWNQASTEQNGHYVIKDVPPGKYKVTAKIPSPGEGAPPTKSDPVAVTLGERKHQTVDIKLAVPKSE